MNTTITFKDGSHGKIIDTDTYTAAVLFPSGRRGIAGELEESDPEMLAEIISHKSLANLVRKYEASEGKYGYGAKKVRRALAIQLRESRNHA